MNKGIISRTLGVVLLGATVAISLIMPSPAGAVVTFSGPTNFSVGTSPLSIAIGDLNGDLIPDLAVTNFTGNNVSILLGTGGGAFGAATNFATGAGPYSVKMGLFNADANLDLAVANRNNNSVSILLGTGTGSFGAATNYAVGTNPYDVAVGDVSGDLNLDLVVANRNSNSVSVLLGTGTGTFGAATNFAAGTGPVSVAIGNLNGDANPDLAIANATSNNVSIKLGTGGGAFGASTNFSVGTTPNAVSLGFLDGDANLDMAVANVISSNVSIRLGTGTGSFGAVTNYAAGTSPYDVEIGDLDGDSIADLAVGNNGSNDLSVLVGSGTGAFAAPVNFAVGTGPIAVGIADLNADTLLDLAAVNNASNNVSILLNTTPPPSYQLSVVLAGSGSGTVTSSPPGINCPGTCSAPFTPSTVVTLIATPAIGSSFAGYTGDPDCSDGVVTMDANKSCTATFTLNTYTLTLGTAGTGAGSVSGGGTYNFGQTATVSATPAVGSTFSGWTGPDATECATGSVLMNANKSCTASFTLNTYTLTLNTAGTGTGTVNGGGVYNYGQTATVSATPTGGSTFAGWSGPNGAECATGSVLMDADKSCTATFDAAVAASRLNGISTRARVQTGDNVMIGGFIVAGSAPKQILIRARGPSLGQAPFFNAGVLADPTMQLFSGSTVIAQNNDWVTFDPTCVSPCTDVTQVTNVSAPGATPCEPNPGQGGPPVGCNEESAVLVTVPPGAYTAIVSGVGGTSGVGLVEVYELDTGTEPKMVAISTRGSVLTGDSVMIGGFIIGGSGSKTVLLRARGPSLGAPPFNNPGVLGDPTMLLFSGSTVIAQNNDWGTFDATCVSPCGAVTQVTNISAPSATPCEPNPGQGGPPPNCALESAILVTLPPGAYTAIVTGVGGTTGMGLVEVFEMTP